jgi:hypothetical protein
MAVMDKDMGKLLNYRQLMNSPKYKKPWGLPAANKFGRLANGIGGCIKTPTNTIKFISEHKILADHRKDSHTGNSYAWSDPKRQNPTKCNSR